MGRKQSTAYPRELISIVRTIAALADIYWHPDCFPKEFKQAQNNWLTALVQFTAGYAYERQGAPPAYRTLAREALLSAGSDLERPDPRFARRVWKEFQRRAAEQGFAVNRKLNPLNDERSSRNVSSPGFVASLADFDHNILLLAKGMIERGEAEMILLQLQAIRGVGPKIAALYLRDVARFFELEEQPGWCFQPVDVWIRRTASYWGELLHRQGNGDRAAARLLAELAAVAGVRGSDLNAGTWVLGSQLLDGELRGVVISEDGLTVCLANNLRWSAAIIQALEPLVRKSNPS